MYSDRIAVEALSGPELVKLVHSPFAREELTGRGPIVFVDAEDLVADERVLETVASTPVVFAGPRLSGVVDVVADEDTLGTLTANVERSPIASVSLVLLLRGAERRPVAEGLMAESAVYSVLQSGPEFAQWRSMRIERSRPFQTGPTVRAERQEDHLFITLSRPQVHNAFSRTMRDELLEALAVAEADPTIARVVLKGDGPSFCSGGDLAEFGSRPDPATAHLVRLERSVGRVVHGLRDRIDVRLHGACMGAGIEIPAFANRVVAHPDVVISLPEVGLGLIPGAGGTVSITRRIGRHRTALLALSGAPIDATTALQWGLVDEVVER